MTGTGPYVGRKPEPERGRDSRHRFRRTPSLTLGLLAACFWFAACTPSQEGKPIVDVEPERSLNTDLVYPKNPQRWAFVSARVDSDPKDRFPGFRVVVANPFAARLREEGKPLDRGAKLVQFVYDARNDPTGVAPGELRRVNLIVRDPERYAATAGWGFASFDGAGRSIPVDAAAECASCHTAGPATHVVVGQ